MRTAKISDIDYITIGLDPVLLGARVGIELDPWQADVMRFSGRQLILNCHRQSGKSTTVALKALHVALYAKALVLLLSPSLRQSRELFRKVIDIYRALDNPPPPITDNRLELELANGSRVVSLPGTEATIRGFSAPKLVIMDEASKIPSALHTAVRPMLAVSRGTLALLSTPYGRRGFFHQEWTSGGPNWKRVLRTADQCPASPPSGSKKKNATWRTGNSNKSICASSPTLPDSFSVTLRSKPPSVLATLILKREIHMALSMI
jgi:hypothetical protein